MHIQRYPSPKPTARKTVYCMGCGYEPAEQSKKILREQGWEGFTRMQITFADGGKRLGSVGTCPPCMAKR